MTEPVTVWWTAEEIFELMPDGTDPASTPDVIESLGIAVADPVWRLEHLHVLRDIDDFQLHDDPDDVDGLTKIDRYADDLRKGSQPPPMMGVRYGDEVVRLADGKHRYNAYVRAGVAHAPVWVARVPG